MSNKNTWYDAGYVNFTTAAVITKFQAVKLSAANTVDVAGAGESAIGICMQATASGSEAPVKLLSAPGTFPCIAAGEIAALAPVYTAALGKVNDDQTGSGAILGYAKSAAAADGDAVEVIREWVVAST